MPVTGDEPEYIYRALSFWHTGGFRMPTSRFAQEMPEFQGIVSNGFMPIPGHPVVMSVLASPFVGLFGTGGRRVVSVICALTSVLSLACLLRPVFGSARALLVTGFVMLTFPVLPYTHLFYTDMMMMALLAASWTLGRQNRTNAVLAGVFCALALPFVHIRASLLAATLISFAAIHLWKRRDQTGLIAGAGLCLLAGGLFLWHQFALFGHLVAGADAVFTPRTATVFDRFMVHLTEFRHGLLTVSPACLLAVAGLVIGAWRRSVLAIQALVLLGVYLPPMIWGAEAESWPARFWVVVMPAMAVGMAFWLTAVRGLPARLAGAGLMLVSILNAAILLQHNSKFLDNRLALMTADTDFPFHDRFDIAGLMPWDSLDFIIFKMDTAPELNEKLLTHAAWFWSALLVAFVLNGLLRFGKISGITTWLPVFGLLPLIFAATMRPVAASAVSITRNANAVSLNFRCPADVRLIRLLSPSRIQMIPPTYPQGLDVTTIQTTDGQTTTWAAPFAPVVGVPPGHYRTIRLTAHGEGANGIWTSGEFVALAAGIRRLRCN
ncbi:hypothetical protein AA21952_1098 [Acetobacter oeni LMG 21952]|nr:hypothetical protein AA21952_1098 [Acetobacter oeni LMG 21952]